jgi:formate/nitrite transporter FocA (FNT family)
MKNRASRNETLDSDRNDGEGSANNETEQGSTPASSNNVPELNRRERQEVSKRARISTLVLHETVREEGERELNRPSSALALSGLAAGLSMGFSLVFQGLLHAYLPAAPWTPLVDNLGYSVGFVIVVLGRQQLFTENTLTAMLPMFTHPDWHTFFKVAKLWAVILVANLVGALLFATIVAHTAVFPSDIQRSFTKVAQHSLRGGFGLTILRGIFAGWLIALMVWLLPATEGTKLHIIILLTYIVALGGFAHIIAGSVDVLYLVNTGAVSWGGYLLGFMLPTLIGNIIGGVSLVAALNFGQVAADNIRNG